MPEPLLKWDVHYFLAINHWGNSFLDYFLGWPTYLGEGFILLPLIGLLMWVWHDGTVVLRRFPWLVANALLAGAVVRVIKMIIDRGRPYRFFYKDIEQGLVTVNFLFRLDIARSFPSGHAAAVWAAAVGLSYLYGRRLWFLYPFAAWISMTRIYVGAHFPFDVLIGSLIGIMSSLFVIVLTRQYLQPLKIK